MTCPVCKLDAPHFKCLGCGMHNALDTEPCISCSYFRFERVDVATVPVAAPEPAAPPEAAHKTKRRQRGADTQRT